MVGGISTKPGTLHHIWLCDNVWNEWRMEGEDESVNDVDEDDGNDVDDVDVDDEAVWQCVKWVKGGRG